MRCWPQGKVAILSKLPSASGDGASGSCMGAVVVEEVQLPEPVNPGTAQALFTDKGELYIRVGLKG